MNIIILNLVFGIVGILVAVGIPVAGLFWQRQESAPSVRAGSLPLGDHRDLGHKQPNRPVPANTWLTDRGPVEAHQRRGSAPAG